MWYHSSDESCGNFPAIARSQLRKKLHYDSNKDFVPEDWPSASPSTILARSINIPLPVVRLDVMSSSICISSRVEGTFASTD